MRRLAFYPDYGAESPFWDSEGSMVWVDSLPLSRELQDAITHWAMPAADDYDDAASRRQAGLLFRLDHRQEQCPGHR